MQRGPFVRRVVDGVGAVAIGTGRRDQEPRLQQSLAVDAQVVGLAVLGVTLPADFHLMVQEHRRRSVLDRQHSMHFHAVALETVHERARAEFVLAARSVVDALAEIDQLLPVALAAGLGQPRRMNR